MREELEISVVIPCYNSGKFIKQTVKSALNQKKRPKEIICVDDGSEDETLRLLNNLKKSGAEITIHSQRNQGICGARNTGLDIATGEYVAFLDHDDILHSEKLGHQAGLISDCSFCPDFVAAAHKEAYPDDKTATRTRQVYTEDPWIGLIHARLGRTSSNLWKASSVREVGAWQDEDGLSLDTGLMFRLLKRDARLVGDFTPLTTRYIRETSASRANRVAQWHTFLTLRAKIYDYLRANSQLTSARLEALHVDMIRAVRGLYEYDSGLALRLHEKLVQGCFESSQADFGPGRLYRRLYQSIGFRYTEVVYPFWLRLRQLLA